MRKRVQAACIILLGAPVLLAAASPALAQPETPAAAAGSGLLPALITLLLPFGLLLLMSSAMPEDDAPATATGLLVAWAAAALAYFGVGFAFQFGGVAQVSSQPDLSGLYWEWYPLDRSVDVAVARLWGVIALRGWALSAEAATPGGLQLFLSHVSLAGAAAMIPVAALWPRGRAGMALITGLLVGGLVYPLAGNWLWGGGWLSSLGASLGLGHGLVDFGGSSVIFLTGSAVALAGLLLLRPGNDSPDAPAEVVVAPDFDRRLTVYGDASALPKAAVPVTPMPTAYLPVLSLLGSGLVLAGWFGLSAGGHMPTALNFSPALAAANGLLAALAAGLASAGYSWLTTRELNPLMTTRGLVAGVVMAAAAAPFLPAWIAVAAGLVMGFALPPLVYLFNQGIRLGDERGALATYGVSAVAGLLLVALFAGGQAGQGWNGIGVENYLGVDGQGVSGLVVASGLSADWPGQFQAQLAGAAAVFVWALAAGLLLFQTVKAVVTAWKRGGWEFVGPAAGPAGEQPAPHPPDSPSTVDPDE